jgi:hypothetical protein
MIYREGQRVIVKTREQILAMPHTIINKNIVLTMPLIFIINSSMQELLGKNAIITNMKYSHLGVYYLRANNDITTYFWESICFYDPLVEVLKLI